MGTRYGCGLEQCGSCMVLVDGQPAYACTREVGTVADRKVTTIEGLGTPAKPHPLQQAFRNPTPSRGDIVAALDRHLFRCGAHQRILRAVERAAVTLRNGGQA